MSLYGDIAGTKISTSIETAVVRQICRQRLARLEDRFR